MYIWLIWNIELLFNCQNMIFLPWCSLNLQMVALSKTNIGACGSCCFCPLWEGQSIIFSVPVDSRCCYDVSFDGQCKKKTSETSWMCQVLCWFWPLRCTQPRIDEAASSKSFPCTAFLDLGFSGLCVWSLFWVFPLCSAASAEHVRVSFERDAKGWTRVRILDLVSQNLVNVALVRRNLKADSCFKNNNI